VTIPADILARCARLALDNVHREYPSHIVHLLTDDADARPPRELTPAFFGSFDWHSAVHAHWSLARLARLDPTAPYAAGARAALATSLTPERLEGERRYLEAPGREGFERPYGLAWLLQLAAELRGWDEPDARAWRRSLEPIERLAAARLEAWARKLPFPVRSGTHQQSAFSFGLALDWARAAGDAEVERTIADRALAHFGADVAAPVEWEPSGHDFLSPLLGEADLMRRVLPPGRFGTWFEAFLPDAESAAALRWLTPVTTPDPSDGHLAHLDGLNLSRAWMLEGIASALPPGGPRTILENAADRHRAAGLAGLAGEHYAGTHWLGSFAVYLVTRRGIAEGAARVRGGAGR
jgi:hypothetical protein